MSLQLSDRSTRSPRLAACFALAAVLISVTLLSLGVTPWAAPLVVIACLSLAIAQRTSWSFALAASLIVPLVGILLLLRITPLLGWGLASPTSLLLLVLGLISVAYLWRAQSLRVTARRDRFLAVSIVAVPFVGAIALLTLSASGDLEWAMHNDAVWNLVTTRLVMSEQGLTSAHPNASPMTAGVLAAAASVGRDLIPAGDLLQHDVTAVAGVWLFANGLSSVLAALITVRAMRGCHVRVQIAGALVVAMIPWLWFTFGFASQYGFYNQSLSLLVLLASWLAWAEVPRRRLVGAGVLSLAAVALLATWAPLAAIPAALAIAAVAPIAVSAWRRPLAKGRLIGVVIAIAPFAIYGFAVTLPDLRRDGAALAVDGAIQPIQPLHVVLIVLTTLVVVARGVLDRATSGSRRGVLIIVTVFALVSAYLIYQRRGSSEWWGYYPAKFGWLVATLLVVLLAAGLLSELAALRLRQWGTVAGFTLAIALPAALMAQVPPATVRLASLFMPITIASQTGVAAGQPAARRLFTLATPGIPTMVMFYLDKDGDTFINSWLLQLESTDASEPIRLYSYILDPRNEQQACEAVHAWGVPVRVVTSDRAFADRFPESCEGSLVDIDLRAP